MKKKYLFKIGIICLFAMTISIVGCNNSRTEATNQSDFSVSPLIAKLTEAINKDSKNPDLFFQRATAFYDIEAFEQALQDLNTATLLDSLQPAYYHLMADVYLNDYKSKEALATLEKTVERFPNDIPSILKLSEIQTILKRYGTAVTTAQQVLIIEPQHPEAHFLIGVNYKIMGDTAKALENLQIAVQQDPDHLDGFLQLGLLMEKQKKDKLALQYFDSALRIDSSDIEVLYAKAMFFTKRKMDEQAIATYERINRIDPQFAPAFFNLGTIYLEYDSLQKAYNFFNISVKVDPAYERGYYYRGLTYEKMGNRAAAINDYKQAINFGKDFAAKAEEGLIRLGAN